MTNVETMDRTGPHGRVEGVSGTDRTRVIMLAQVVTIVALLLTWWILRARRSPIVIVGDSD